MLDSRFAAYIAVTIFCFHPAMLDLYVNNGAVYDVVGTFWFLLAAWLYLRSKFRKAELSWKSMLLITVCVVAGLGSKEFVAMAPFAFLVVEILFQLDGLRTRRRLQIATLAFFTALCALSYFSIQGKTRPGGPLTGPYYKPHFSARHFAESMDREMSEMICKKDGQLSPILAISLHLAPLAMAAVSRRRSFALLFVFLVISSIPMWAIVWRGLFVYQLCLVWWSLIVSHGIVLGSVALFGSKDFANAERFGGLLLIATVFHLSVTSTITNEQFSGPHHGNREVRGDIADYERLRLRLPPGGSMLLLNDRCGTDTWTPMFIARLFFSDRNLRVDRVKMKQHVPSFTYDAVLDLKDNKLVLVGGTAVSPKPNYVPTGYPR